MPDPARVAQAQALEVPLILKGATTDEGTGRRELFTENATTTLVFDDGAVLNLRSRLAVGQAVLIHNKQNGREVLCKVLEAPPAGEAGYTDLEFTTADPAFWAVDTQQSDPSAQIPQAAEKHETHNPPEAPAEDTLAMMSATASKIELPALTAPGKEPGMPLREELVPAHLMVPEASAMAPMPALNIEQTEPSGEQIDAALRQMSVAAPPSSPEVPGAPPRPDSAAGNEQTQDERHLAALMAREARFAKFVAIKEKQAEMLKRDAAAKTAEDVAPPEPAPVTEEKGVLTRTELMLKLASAKQTIIIQIAASVAVVVSLAFLWHTLHGVFFPAGGRAPAAVAVAKPETSTGVAPPAQGLVSGVATAPGVAAPSPSAPPRPVPGVSAPKFASGKSSEVDSSGITTAPSKHQNPIEANAPGIVPVKVLSQPQPTLPSWAKGLDVGGVVTLDAVIDEEGNVAQTKVLSGPRVLQHAAEQAIGLWLFKPALSAGRPISTHIVLTVDFQQ
jgi:TonB family protein